MIKALVISTDGSLPMVDTLLSECEMHHCADLIDALELNERSHLELLIFCTSNIDQFASFKETFDHMPSIVFSHDDPGSDRSRFLNAGADFYFSWNANAEELSGSISRIKRNLQQMEQLAFRDPLTGAFNRRYFERYAKVEVSRAKYKGLPLALALLDIDRFKQINDTYGHSFGDDVLKGLAGFLNEHVLGEERFFRLGGEEFVLLMPGANCEEAGKRMREVLDAIQTYPVAFSQERPYCITFSAGVAQLTEGQTVYEVLKLADDRLYEAKKRGRNRVEGGESQLRGNGVSGLSVLLIGPADPYRNLLMARVGRLHAVDSLRKACELGGDFDVVLVVDLVGKVDSRGIQLLRSQFKIPVMMLYPNKAPDFLQVLNAGIDDCLISPFTEEEIYYKLGVIADKIGR